MIANLGNSVEAALDINLITNKNAVANLKRFQVFKADTAANLHPVTEASSNGAPNGTADKLIQLAIAISEARILFKKSCRRGPVSQVPGQFQLKGWILFYLPLAVNGRDGTVFLTVVRGHL
jgi:hypothetical protein